METKRFNINENKKVFSACVDKIIGSRVCKSIFNLYYTSLNILYSGTVVQNFRSYSGYQVELSKEAMPDTICTIPNTT